MKLTKRKNDTSTIRKVWNDDKTKCYGVVGTVGDLLQQGILESCDCNCEMWLFLSVCSEKKDKLGESREAALK